MLRVKVMNKLVKGSDDLLIPELCVVAQVIKSDIGLTENLEKLVHMHR